TYSRRKDTLPRLSDSHGFSRFSPAPCQKDPRSACAGGIPDRTASLGVEAGPGQRNAPHAGSFTMHLSVRRGVFSKTWRAREVHWTPPQPYCEGVVHPRPVL